MVTDQTGDMGKELSEWIDVLARGQPRTIAITSGVRLPVRHARVARCEAWAWTWPSMRGRAQRRAFERGCAAAAPG
eukprot:5713187-Pyramimonas_sp.AAC.1